MSITIYDQLEQGSDDWLAARCGMLTASNIGKLITPSTLKTADNETSRGLTLTLAAERITGHVEHVYPSTDMQRGTDDEPFARNLYAEHHAPVTEVGFIVRTEDGLELGYSPDGLVGDDGLIEVKSRNPKSQIATILSGRIPAYNTAQLQAGLFVTGRSWIDYVSYAQGFPLWVKRVTPDTGWQNAIHTALQAFEHYITNIIANYSGSVIGLPVAERRPDYEEIRI